MNGFHKVREAEPESRTLGPSFFPGARLKIPGPTPKSPAAAPRAIFKQAPSIFNDEHLVNIRKAFGFRYIPHV
jgi:hypothetical protein